MDSSKVHMAVKIITDQQSHKRSLEKERCLHVAWIDIHKAFGSISYALRVYPTNITHEINSANVMKLRGVCHELQVNDLANNNKGGIYKN